MKHNYKTSLTKEDFVNALNEIQLTPNELNLLEVLYDNRKQALTGLKLQAYSKAKSVGAVNLTLSRIAKKITKYTGVFPEKEEDGKYSWWSLLVLGEWLGVHFSWQLKPELAEALETLNFFKKIEERIARLCWNTEGWKKPSGAKAKSKNKNAYTSFFGFGWEEWLFDIEKSIDDYHYGFIQAINKHWDKYQNTIMNISLYSINGETKEKYWLGEIKEAEIITRNTAKKILKIYKKERWLGEMKNQVKSINGDLNEFKYDNLFNLRYKIEHLNIFEKPIKIKKNDPAIKATYFGTLLYYKTAPNLGIKKAKPFEFIPGHHSKKVKVIHSRKESTKEIKLFHNEMQEDIYKQFVEEFGLSNVSTENNTGLDTMVDIVVQRGKNYTFYELKAYASINKCIREALSQVMEYAYFPNENRAKELIIISQNEIDLANIDYLKKLRTEFKIPIFYQQFDIETRKVKSKKY